MSSERNESHLPYFEPGSGYYGRTLGILNKNSVHMSQELVLSFLGKIKSFSFTICLNDLSVKCAGLACSRFVSDTSRLHLCSWCQTYETLIHHTTQRNQFTKLCHIYSFIRSHHKNGIQHTVTSKENIKHTSQTLRASPLDTPRNVCTQKRHTAHILFILSYKLLTNLSSSAAAAAKCCFCCC